MNLTMNPQSQPIAQSPALSTYLTSFVHDACVREASEVTPLLDRVVDALREQAYPPAACRELRLALEEAVVNGIRHGNAGDPAKRVRVRYRVGPEAIVVEVEDEGPGFDPYRVPDPTACENLDKPSGRGLLLMRHSTSWLCYHGRGNHLTFCKYRAPQ